MAECEQPSVTYHAYVIESVERGLADAAEGRTISHEKVAADLRRKWLTDPVRECGPSQSAASGPGAVV
jgi:predicted transcriptional regulator